jgi:hypothetical protein
VSKADAAEVRVFYNPASLVIKQLIALLAQLWTVNHEIISAEL